MSDLVNYLVWLLLDPATALPAWIGMAFFLGFMIGAGLQKFEWHRWESKKQSYEDSVRDSFS